jgi:hypothetical protein
MLPLTQYLTILRNLKVNRKQIINCANQNLQDNEDWMISEFRLTGRAARSIPRPLGRGGRAQFDLDNDNKIRTYYYVLNESLTILSHRSLTDSIDFFRDLKIEWVGL